MIKSEMKKTLAALVLLTFFGFTIVVLVPSAFANTDVDFSWAPSGEPYAGEEVTFTANISEFDEDCIMSYEWNFGDSYTASGKTVTHQLAKGNNTITLTFWRAVTTGEETTQYAIWANSTTGSPGFKLASSGCVIEGKIHSNNDVVITPGHIINGTIEYVSDYSGPEEFTYVSTSPEPFPIHYNIPDYKPGGLKTIAAQAEGKYHLINETLNVGEDAVLEGLYYVTSTAELIGSNISGIFTIVAEGNIWVSGNQQNCSAYLGNLLFLSNGTEFKIDGSNSYFGGSIYAPKAKIHVSGANNAIKGALFGDTILISASGLSNAIEAPIIVNVSKYVNASGGIGLMELGCYYVSELVPIELKFNVTKNVSADLMIDGYKIWERDTICSIENVIWIPESSGRHVITSHLYSLNGMECDNSSGLVTTYIKRVTVM